MSKKDGGPAFPLNASNSNLAKTAQGMTLRQYYAGQAMMGLCSNLKYQQSSNPAEMVRTAIRVTDMLMDELEKE